MAGGTILQAGEGDDFVMSTVVDCMQGDTVLLAGITIDWSDEYAGSTSFPVSAEAVSPARDCTIDRHLLLGLHVDISGTPVQTDDASASWGDLKAGLPGMILSSTAAGHLISVKNRACL